MALSGCCKGYTSQEYLSKRYPSKGYPYGQNRWKLLPFDTVRCEHRYMAKLEEDGGLLWAKECETHYREDDERWKV